MLFGEDRLRETAEIRAISGGACSLAHDFVIGDSVLRHPGCLVAALLSAGIATLSAQSAPRITFRSALDLVSVAVVVRAPDGRIVPNLRASDFEVLDCGVPQTVVQFRSGEDGDARLALLVDSSGSMALGSKRQRSELATEFLATAFRGEDAASVFSFDSRVRRLTPFTRDADALRTAVSGVEPYGTTRLYDAIATTVRAVSQDTPRARAVMLLTDGMDNASQLSPSEAASAAAALDLPLYVLAVDGDETAIKRSPVPSISRSARAETMSLNELAVRTGGLASEPATAMELRATTHAILDELRHQYVLAIPAASVRGWHELSVRVRRGRVHARSREGYFVS